MEVTAPKAVAIGASSPVTVESAVAAPTPPIDANDKVKPESSSPAKSASEDVPAEAPSPAAMASPNVITP